MKLSEVQSQTEITERFAEMGFASLSSVAGGVGPPIFSSTWLARRAGRPVMPTAIFFPSVRPISAGSFFLRPRRPSAPRRMPVLVSASASGADGSQVGLGWEGEEEKGEL